MSSLLDTDFLIDYLTGQQRAQELFPALLSRGVAISIITYPEIYEGIYGSRNPREAEVGFTTLLKGVSVYPISRSVAKRNAEVRRDLRAAGRPITHRALDLLIAATALVHGLDLATRNTRDYDDIPGLTLHQFT